MFSFGLASASVSPQSCHTKLIELFSEKLYLIGLAALVVAVIMVSVGLKRRKTQLWCEKTQSVNNISLRSLSAVKRTQVLE